MFIELKNTDNFDQLISKGKVLVDFFATWCGPCKMLTPVLHELDEESALGDVTILKVDVDEFLALARTYQIQAVPTLILFENGKVIKQTMGYKTPDELISFCK